MLHGQKTRNVGGCSGFHDGTSPSPACMTYASLKWSALATAFVAAFAGVSGAADTITGCFAGPPLPDSVNCSGALSPISAGWDGFTGFWLMTGRSTLMLSEAIWSNWHCTRIVPVPVADGVSACSVTVIVPPPPGR